MSIIFILRIVAGIMKKEPQNMELQPEIEDKLKTGQVTENNYHLIKSDILFSE